MSDTELNIDNLISRLLEGNLILTVNFLRPFNFMFNFVNLQREAHGLARSST